MYYLKRVFWGFFEPPNYLLKNSFSTWYKEKLSFSEPPTQLFTPISLRNM